MTVNSIAPSALASRTHAEALIESVSLVFAHFRKTRIAVNTPSVEPVLRSRLLPRISFRMMFVIMTLCAILAAIARAAGNGGQFASAAGAMVAFAIACIICFSLIFLLAWCAAMFRVPTGLAGIAIAAQLAFLELTGYRLFDVSNWPLVAFAFTAGLFLLIFRPRDPDIHRDNPFAEGQLPPQILPPREKSL